MNIVVDARQITSKHSEPGRYMEELAKRLPVLEPSWNWTFIFSDDDTRKRILESPELKGRSGIAFQISTPASNVFANFFTKENYDCHCDLYFSPDAPGSRYRFKNGPGRNARFVCVTSFLSAIRRLKSLRRNPFKQQLFSTSLKQSVRRSAAIITQSATARNDIVSDLGLTDEEKDRIHCIYNGVSDVFKAGGKVSEARNSSCKAILSVTNYPFDKDTDVLLRAYSKLMRDKTFADTKLICIGPENSNTMHIRKTARSLGCQDSVIAFAGVSAEDVAKVSREAILFVNPSAYEDFGQSIIEAMASGLPTICCKNGAQGEIVRNAAQKIPSDDAQALADAMKYFLTDAKSRRVLSELGVARASEFTWEQTAREHVELFRSILNDKGASK